MATHTDTQTTPTHAALVAELLREGQTAHQWALCRRHVVRGDFPACTQAIAQFPDLLHMVDPLDLCSLLHVAVGAQNLDIVKELLRLGAGHEANRVGSTPLHFATLFDSLEIVVELLNGGCPIDATNCVGETALFSAVRLNRTACVAHLLASGANPNAATPLCGTVLCEAARVSSQEILSLLLGAGARPDDQRKLQGSPLHIAIRFREPEVRVCLNSAAFFLVSTCSLPLFLLLLLVQLSLVLLKAGASCKALDHSKRDALANAIIYHNNTAVLNILKAGYVLEPTLALVLPQLLRSSRPVDARVMDYLEAAGLDLLLSPRDCALLFQRAPPPTVPTLQALCRHKIRATLTLRRLREISTLPLSAFLRLYLVFNTPILAPLP
eukprot:m.318269 g.318269  ORF g.318269 m.318269 type:complete len:382 (-) comp55485_c0_seq15:69-1214(-)